MVISRDWIHDVKPHLSHNATLCPGALVVGLSDPPTDTSNPFDAFSRKCIKLPLTQAIAIASSEDRCTYREVPLQMLLTEARHWQRVRL